MCHAKMKSDQLALVFVCYAAMLVGSSWSSVPAVDDMAKIEREGAQREQIRGLLVPRLNTLLPFSTSDCHGSLLPQSKCHSR